MYCFLRPEGDQVFTLKGAEYAYRALVEAMNEGAATLDVNGIVLYCNQRLSELAGVPLEQIIGNPVTQLVTNEARRTLETLLAHALSGNSAKAEIELREVEGCRKPVYISLREMKFEKPTALCLVVTDLAEQKKGEDLIAAGKLATSILESAAEAIAVCDETGKIISVNKALETLCGVNPLHQPFDKALPLQVKGDSGASSNQFSISRPLAGVNNRAEEVTYRRNDGQVFSLLLSAGRISGPSGVAGCVLTLTDITERKRAEEALRNSERLYRAIGESIDYGVWVCAPDGRNTYASESFLRMVGITQQQCSDFGWTSLLHPDDAELTVAAWKECVRSEKPWEYEHRFHGTDNQWHSVLARGVPVRDDEGHIKCWAGLNVDISKVKETELALIRSEKLASLGSMAAKISHEINNPLGAVMNLLFLISEDSLPAASRQLLEKAEVEVKHIAQIVNTTLGLARRDAPAVKFRPVEVLDGVLALLDHKLRDKGITCSKQVEAQEMEIIGSAGEVRQVLWNVLNNAADAILDHGRIVVRVSPSQDWRSLSVRGVRITIADNGCGITPEAKKKIFEPFFTTKQTGTGLGLSVTFEIIEKHGGSITMRSRTGATQHGTVFSVFIPEVPPSEERTVRC